MKVTYKLLVPALLAGFLLAACAEKEAEAPAEEMATEEAASDEPGGYVPTDDELIAGETR